MKDKLESDLKTAQLSKDTLKTATLRLVLSELKNSQIQKGSDLTDQEIIQIIQKEVKKRHEAAEAFNSGGRSDMAQNELEEAKILNFYLPEQLSDEELTKLVQEAITELGAKSMSDMGKVIGKVMEKVGNSADGSKVAQIAKESLLKN